MANKKITAPVEGAVAPSDALHFARIAGEVMQAPLPAVRRAAHAAADSEKDMPLIGTLQEKRMHAAIKRYLCADTACHERPVPDFLAAEESGGRSRRVVADILTDGEIMEVQTSGFHPLRKKIDYYLTHTPYRVTAVHPIPAVRYLSWINPADGQIISRRKSPKRGRVKDVARELYWLSEYAGNPRFSIRLLLVELEEYRLADGWSRDGKRGSNRYERFPTALLGDVTLATADDYAAYFLPASLCDCSDDLGDPRGSSRPFTAADYARASGIHGMATYSMLRLLCSLGLVEQTEKIGRSQGYRAVKKP